MVDRMSALGLPNVPQITAGMLSDSQALFNLRGQLANNSQNIAQNASELKNYNSEYKKIYEETKYSLEQVKIYEDK